MGSSETQDTSTPGRKQPKHKHRGGASPCAEKQQKRREAKRRERIHRNQRKKGGTQCSHKGNKLLVIFLLQKARPVLFIRIF